MSIHKGTLKYVSFDFDGNEFRAQLKSWKLNNNSDDPDKIYTFGPDGQNEDSEDEVPDWELELSFYSDWRTPTGISHWLWLNRGNTVTYTIHHNLGSTGEDPTFSGEVKIKAPSVGGDVRTTEVTDLTLPVVGEPDYTPPA
jgi:hypothetical protein